MKLTGKLKELVEKTTNREEAKETIAQAGMLLEDDELDQVAGGGFDHIELMEGSDYVECPNCGQRKHKDEIKIIQGKCYCPSCLP